MGSPFYWLNMNDGEDYSITSMPLIPDLNYDLHQGANLISYPAPWPADIATAFPGDVEDQIFAVIGESEVALNTESGWQGSLDSFEGGNGYWVITSDDVEFSFQTDGMARISQNKWIKLREQTAKKYYYYEIK